MAQVEIKGIPPWDGSYELDPDRPFNTREWSWIKRLSGYMPLTISDGFAGHDPSLFVALSVIAMCRSGRVGQENAIRVAEQLFEAPWDFATITLIDDDPVEDAADDVPLDSTPPPVGLLRTGSGSSGG